LSAQGRYRLPKVVKLCSQENTSYSLVQTLLLQDISYYRLATMHRVTDRRTGEVIMPTADRTACSTIGIVLVVENQQRQK